MAKPRARYQGVTERVTTESASPPPPDAIEGVAPKKGARDIKGKRQRPDKARLTAPFSIPKTTASKSYVRNFLVKPARVCVSVFL